MTWHGGHDQDRIAWDALGRKHGGTFVDIGASDGVTRSNSWALERDHRWTGVCVEPNLHTFTLLRANRPSTLCVHACVGAEFGLVRFHEDAGNPEISAVRPAGAAVVPCIPLRTILDHATLRTVDYLSIDTEGAEWDILRTLDLTTYRITLIDFEHNDHWSADHKRKRALIEERLTAHGYTHLCDSGVDAFWIRR